MQNWDTALEDLNRLKEVIEANVSYKKMKYNLQFIVRRSDASLKPI